MTMTEERTHSGWLNKQKDSQKRWKKKYCVCENGELVGYEGEKKKIEKFRIPIETCILEEHSSQTIDRPNGFQIRSSTPATALKRRTSVILRSRPVTTVHAFEAADAKDKDTWIACLKSYMTANAQPVKEFMTCQETAMIMTHFVCNDDVGASSVQSIGFLLRLMDICACASAEKLSHRPSVTLSMDDLVFHASTKLSAGDLVVVKSQVNCAFNTSMEVGVTCEIEDVRSGHGSKRLCRAYFTFVALGDDGKKTKIPNMTVKLGKDISRNAMAQERRKLRFRRKEIIQQHKDQRRMSVSSPKHAGITAFAQQAAFEQLERSKSDEGEAANQSTPKPASQSKTVITEIVLPPHANHMGNSFGGQIMAWMDKAAAIAASRHARVQIGQPEVELKVTHIDDVFFVGPSTVGDRIEITATVTRVFSHNMEVSVVVVAFGLDGNRRVINQAFWIVSTTCNSDLNLLKVDTVDEKLHFQEALGRRALRILRKELSDQAHKENVISFQWNDQLSLDICQKNVRSIMQVIWGDVRWSPIPYEHPNMIVSSKSESGMTCVKCEIIVKCPADIIADCVVDVDKRKQWDATLVDVKVKQQVDESNDIGHWIFRTPNGKVQDFSLLRSWSQVGDRFVVCSRSVTHPAVPQTDDYNRGEVLSAGFVIDSVPEGTKLRELGVSISSHKSASLSMAGDEEGEEGDSRENDSFTHGWTRLVYVLQLGRSATQMATEVITGQAMALYNNYMKLEKYAAQEAASLAELSSKMSIISEGGDLVVEDA